MFNFYHQHMGCQRMLIKAAMKYSALFALFVRLLSGDAAIVSSLYFLRSPKDALALVEY